MATVINVVLNGLRKVQALGRCQKQEMNSSQRNRTFPIPQNGHSFIH